MCSLAAILQHHKNKVVVEGKERIRGEKREVSKKKKRSFLGLGNRGDSKSEREREGERERGRRRLFSYKTMRSQVKKMPQETPPYAQSGVSSIS